jgi:hypothetical protein
MKFPLLLAVFVAVAAATTYKMPIHKRLPNAKTQGKLLDKPVSPKFHRSRFNKGSQPIASYVSCWIWRQ